MENNLYYGRGRDEDNKKLIAFLDKVFFSGETSTRDFLSLLPKIYKDEYRPAYNNFVVQDSEGNFRAAIGNFYTTLKVGGQTIKACCLGNVAVGKEYRSMGYMIDLMEMSVNDLYKNGFDMAYLGGQRQRYGYFGFESSGVNYAFNVNPQTVKHALKGRKNTLTVKLLEPSDSDSLEMIDKLYAKRTVHAVRPIESLYDTLCSWRATPYLLFDGDSFAGYFVMSYEKNRVSEYGLADKKYYDDLLAAALDISDKGSVSFGIAPYDRQGIEYFTVNSEGVGTGGCEAVLVFSFRRVVEAYLKAKAEYLKLADGELTVLIHGQFGDEKLRITVTDNRVEVDDFDGEAEYELGHHEATRAFFSIFPGDREKLNLQAQQWFPVPNHMLESDTM